jgi:hypothetical protein
MKKLSSTLLASLIGAGVLVAAPSASADMPSNMEIGIGPVKFPGSDGMMCASHHMRDHRDSRVCWDRENDRFYVKDDERDGYSAVASWSIPGKASGYCRNKEKAGHWAICNLTPSPADTEIIFAAGVYDGNGETHWPSRFQDWTDAVL